jgi:hypothetical protein
MNKSFYVQITLSGGTLKSFSVDALSAEMLLARLELEFSSAQSISVTEY